MRRITVAAIAILASAGLALAGCSKSPGADSSTSPTPTSTEPVGVSVDKAELPEVEGTYAKEANLLFPLKPGETRPPSVTPTPSESASDTPDPEPQDSATASATGTADPAAASDSPSTTDTPAATEATEPGDEADTAAADESESPSPSPSPTPSPYKDPPTSLQSEVIKAGDGAEIKVGNLVTVFYRGQIWGNTDAFDENFTSATPSTMRLESGALIDGWVRGLRGKKIGSRVLLVIPPGDGGYGVTGDPYGTIKGTDTIAFVIDVIAQFDPKMQADKDAKPTGAKTNLDITGELGAEPTIASPVGVTPPEEVTTTVLATGSGEAIPDGRSVLVQLKAVDWSGQEAGNSWTEGAGATTVQVDSSVISDPNSITAFSQLNGLKVGSRVLVELPGKQDAYLAVAVVIDIVALVPNG